MSISIFYKVVRIFLFYALVFYSTAIKSQNLNNKNTIGIPGPQLFSFGTLSRYAVLAKAQKVAQSQVEIPAPLRIAATCNTSTFYMHLKAQAGEKIEIKEIITLTNGNFLLAGNLTLVNTEQVGILCLLSNTGNIITQQQLRINNKPISISNAKALLDGNFVISGIVHNIKDEVFITYFNADLSNSWLQKFAMESTPLTVALDIQPDNTIAFAVQTLSGVFYALLNSTGSVVWSQQLFPSGLDMVAGMGHNDFNGISLVLNCTRGGKKLVELVTFSKDNGAVLVASIVGDSADNRVTTKVTSFSSRFITLGVVENGSSQFKLVRDILFDAKYLETEHNYTISGLVDLNITCAMDNAGDALGFCLSSQGKMIYIRHFSAYQVAPEYTRQYSVPVGATMAAVARSLKDGGYLFGVNTKNNNETILIKTDSIGIIGGCGYEDIANSYTETIQPPVTISSAIANSVQTTNIAGALNSTALLLNVQADCNQTYCPVSPPDDTCLSSYFKTFRSNSYVDGFSGYHLMRNNNHLMVTSRSDRIIGNANVATYGVKLFDEKGNFIKGINVFSNGFAASVDSKKIDDSHVVLIYYSINAGMPCYTFILINDNLDILWSRSFKNSGNFYFNNSNFTTDKEGNFYIVGNSLGYNDGAKVLAFKFDKNGNSLWLKAYQLQIEILSGITATTSNTSLITVIEGNNNGSVSLSFDKNTGELQHAYNYNNSGGGIGYERFLKFNNDRIFYAGSNINSDFIMGIFDTTGKPVVLKHIKKSSVFRMGTVKDGKLYADYSYFNGTVMKLVFLKVDTALSVEYIHEFDFTSNDGYSTGMDVSDNGSIYVAGNYASGGVNSNYLYPFLKKFDPNGILGTCNYTDLNPDIENVMLNTTTISFSPISGTVFTPISIPIEFEADTYGQQINKLLCSSMPSCKNISLSGADSICQLSQPYTYYAKRNEGCILKPFWIVDTNMINLNNLSDTSAALTFKKTGNTWIKVKLNTGCAIYQDSMLVRIQNASAALALGNDTVLCKGDSILLHAGKGFSAYLWQDGSTDSTLAIHKPGQYNVQVNSFCGNTMRDTINISTSDIPLLSIGKDSSICLGDTLFISASSGFNVYAWQPLTLKPGKFPQEVFSIPVNNETITVKATTMQGCTAYDTLKLTSIRARSIQLGSDTSFCYQDSIKLSAENGYLQYTWSTGSLAPAIIAKKAGVYWVAAKDINGCIAKDTLVVKQVYALPVLNLGNDFNLCKGTQLQLNAGYFNQYFWQDGSLKQYYTVSLPGNYWVKVTDGHQCSFTDTIALLQILPNPANFLKSTDSICQYEQLQITSSQIYIGYLWSTGATQKDITVSAPGNYILKVQDINGCVGKDTIKIIQKKCTSGVYIPSAFSPNNDFINDIFKATVYGTVISFHLEIFNRYGEIIFKTADSKTGWNGLINGKPQPNGSFVWQCSYQLPGSAIIYKKGFVTLVR